MCFDYVKNSQNHCGTLRRGRHSTNSKKLTAAFAVLVFLTPALAGCGDGGVKKCIAPEQKRSQMDGVYRFGHREVCFDRTRRIQCDDLMKLLYGLGGCSPALRIVLAVAVSAFGACLSAGIRDFTQFFHRHRAAFLQVTHFYLLLDRIEVGQHFRAEAVR